MRKFGFHIRLRFAPLALAIASLLPLFASGIEEPDRSCYDYAKFTRLLEARNGNPLEAIAWDSDKADLLRRYFIQNKNPNYNDVETFAGHIRRLPPGDQQIWLRAIARVSREGEHRDSRVGELRLLNRLFLRLQRPDMYFLRQVEPRLPAKIFTRYLDETGSYFGIQYTGDDVIRVAQGLQRLLRELAERNPKTELAGQSARYTIVGSFVNGRARVGISDVDINTNSSAFLASASQVQAVVDRVIGRDLERHMKSSLMTGERIDESFFGTTNAFSLRVTRDQIELLVYPPAIHSEDGRSLEAATPMVFPLEIP